MRLPEPFFREAGAGPGVVCIHSNASTSGQWRGLMDLLSPDDIAMAVRAALTDGGSEIWVPARNQWLDAPVRRVAATDTFVAYAPELEDVILPQVSHLRAAMAELAAY